MRLWLFYRLKDFPVDSWLLSELCSNVWKIVERCVTKKKCDTSIRYVHWNMCWNYTKNNVNFVHSTVNFVAIMISQASMTAWHHYHDDYYGDHVQKLMPITLL